MPGDVLSDVAGFSDDKIGQARCLPSVFICMALTRLELDLSCPLSPLPLMVNSTSLFFTSIFFQTIVGSAYLLSVIGRRSMARQRHVVTRAAVPTGRKISAKLTATETTF